MKISKEENIKYRCPLMGATKGIGMLEDAIMLVIGTEECTYYTKATQTIKGNREKCFSVVLDNHDVTFGSYQKVEIAVKELMEEYSPKLLFLVTTCVVEIIGDNFNSIAEKIKEEYKISVEIIQTNHFKGKDEEYGMELVMLATGKTFIKNKLAMRKQEKSLMTKEEKIKMMKEKMEMRQ